ncbi:MAG TPA: PEP-CTERM sorting domain-containing protein [Bryobacteraceae bacterium]|nr:PEP-CTERM sorting domain-containing protein [Bryobacteraceae bacterium]
MRRAFCGYTFAVACAVFLLTLPASATQIVINNPGFETPVSFTNSCCTPTQMWESGSVPGWEVTNPDGAADAAGVWQPVPYFYNANGVLNQLFLYPQTGTQVAYSNGGIISQTLATNATPNTVYVLSVGVGLRGELAFLNPAYTINLFAGDTLIGSWTDDAFGTGHTNPSTGTALSPLIAGGWQTISFATQNTTIAGVPLKIQLYAAGVQIDFDNVFLNSFPVMGVPEPGTYALMGSALLALGIILRRRKKTV